MRELQEKHAVDDAEFFVDGAPWLQGALFKLSMHSPTKPSANAIPSNVSFKR
ncbi:hypothetical protein HLASF_1526 [Halanaeroarchaeum sulfurireducens]|uniref:Uncharacterized protein n=1 Tax=Halanaeroarchaeum sulfurireducens TaxID=1604004 RepID=A0A0F7PCV8_9EURY|nr:hypothetical protein HLASF_1526 [Halanaeroarchaeum sulfurireducens]ALG82399.1 hypothetical protein HLASA_1513 [Halanaeroarchaeum sulfurireducens]